MGDSEVPKDQEQVKEQTNTTVINDKSIKELQDVLGDFVEFRKMGKVGFEKTQDYIEGVSMEERKIALTPAIELLLVTLENPQTANELLDIVSSLDNNDVVKAFLGDPRVKSYFLSLKNLDYISNKKEFESWKDDAEHYAGAKDYKQYKEMFQEVAKKYNDLLVKYNPTPEVQTEKAPTTASSPDKAEALPGSPIFDQLKEYLEKPLSLTKMTHADMTTWAKQATELRDHVKMSDFVSSYIAHIQASLEKKINELENDKMSLDKEGKKQKKEELKNLKDLSKSIESKKEEFKKSITEVVKQIDVMLLGTSVDDLLNSTNLTVDAILGTPDKPADTNHQKTLNNAFHMNESDYQKILSALSSGNEPQKKNAQTMTLAYAQLMADGNETYKGLLNDITPDQIVSGASLKTTNPTAYTTLRDDCFYILKKDNSGLVRVGVSPLTVSFGKEAADVTSENAAITQGTSYDFEEILKSNSPDTAWVRKLFTTNLDGSVNAATKTNKTEGGQKYSGHENFGDALHSLFNSDMWDQLQILFLSLSAMTTKVESEEKKKELEISYLSIKSSLRKEAGFPDPKNPDKILSYALVLSKYEPSSTKPDSENSYKHKFISASTEVQKKYIQTAKTSGLTKAYEVLDGNVSLSSSPTPPVVPEASPVPSGVEIFANTPVNVSELKMNSILPGSVELKNDANNPYLVVDGQVVALLPSTESDGSKIASMFVKTTPDGTVQEKKIIISPGANGKQNIVVENVGSPMDVSSAQTTENNKVFKDNKLQYPDPMDPNQFTRRQYFAFSPLADGMQSWYGTVGKVTDLGIKTALQQSLANAQRKILSLGADKRIKNDIQEIITEVKTAMVKANTLTEPAINPTKQEVTTAINSWAARFGVGEDVS